MSSTSTRWSLGCVASVVAALLVAGCAAGPDPLAYATSPPVAGFWLGLWHGFIIPVAVIVSIFNHSVGIYEVVNTGTGYDLGFVIGLSVVFSLIHGPRVVATRSRRRTAVGTDG